MSTVLVTGGSGFLGSHCIVTLLATGHDVRTTVRSAEREPQVRAMLREAGASGEVTFFEADLTNDAGWSEAVRGCDYVLHVASPFPAKLPNDEDELIVPAREGTLRVLRAACEHGVRRVVLTSSFAAIGYGKDPGAAPFDETSWTDPARPGLGGYIKSKTIAEKAAWDFVRERELELAVINPVGIFGPLLGPDASSSVELIRRMMAGDMPGVPRLYFGVVDVRDVADLHVRAMTAPSAKGERFLAVSGDFLTMFQLAQILAKDGAPKAPKRELPSWLVRLAALWKPELRATLGELGKVKNGSNEKARRLLGWAPRPSEEAIVATARTLRQFGLVQ